MNSIKDKKFVKNLDNRLRPIYKLMFSNIKNIEDYWLFCATWGKYFPDEKKSGILFYGRAANGWYDYTQYLDPFDGIFCKEDQMDWMLKYQTKPIARLIKKVSSNFYSSDWNQHIAWSNVCKVSPNNNIGLPNENLWYRQYQYMVDIMRVELQELSPRIVIFITGVTGGKKWDDPFFEMEEYKDIQYTDSIEWCNDFRGNKCSTQACKKDGTIFIRTDRPEYRPINDQAESIIKLVGKLG